MASLLTDGDRSRVLGTFADHETLRSNGPTPHQLHVRWITFGEEIMRRLVAARRPLQTQSAAISPSLTCRANRGHSGTIPTIRIPRLARRTFSFPENESAPNPRWPRQDLLIDAALSNVGA
jgi:hypothetical protein